MNTTTYFNATKQPFLNVKFSSSGLRSDYSIAKGLEIIGINPNPTSGITYAELSLAGAENVQFTVMDLNGKILFEQKVQGNRVEFNMAGFNAGLYIASIYGNGMVPFTRSFIVK